MGLNLSRMIDYVNEWTEKKTKQINGYMSIHFPLCWSRDYFSDLGRAVLIFVCIIILSLLFLAPNDGQSTLEIPINEYHQAKTGLIIVGLFFFLWPWIFSSENFRVRRRFFEGFRSFNIREERAYSAIMVLTVGIFLLSGNAFDAWVKKEFKFNSVDKLIEDYFETYCGPSINYEFYYMTRIQNIEKEKAKNFITDSLLYEAGMIFPNIVNSSKLEKILGDYNEEDSINIIRRFLWTKYYLGKDKIDELVQRKYAHMLKINQAEWRRFTVEILEKARREYKYDSTFTIKVALFVFFIILPGFSYFSRANFSFSKKFKDGFMKILRWGYWIFVFLFILELALLGINELGLKTLWGGPLKYLALNVFNFFIYVIQNITITLLVFGLIYIIIFPIIRKYLMSKSPLMGNGD
ncbi:MAG TPA: hypothetical protein PKB07_20710 [Flavilitoribacter sp.]|nr:hypothetical protein [Flavilitoribacter sp.]